MLQSVGRTLPHDTATSENVWRFSSPSSTASPGFVGLSPSRKLWNRMELAEEEREEEALPSYLSYLQPPRSKPSSTLSKTTTCSSEAKAPAVNESIESPAPVPPSSTHVEHVTQKSAELAHALEQLVHDSLHRRLGHHDLTDTIETPSACFCASLRLEVQDMKTQLHQLQSQVLEVTKKTWKDAPGGAQASKALHRTWGPHAAPFVPKEHKSKAPAPHVPSPCLLDPSIATTLSDRISTLEGRQSAFQSHLAQIAKALEIPMGKVGKQSPVKHVVQTLRDEVDRKVQEAMDEAQAALGRHVEALVRDQCEAKQTSDERDAVLAALASEHEASLVRLSTSFETVLSEETRQRTAFEARIQSQIEQHDEWLQQLEAACGSPHHAAPFRTWRDPSRPFESTLDTLLATLERRDGASRDFCERLARLLVDLPTSNGCEVRPDEDEVDEANRG
ncbi:hypothetical protein PsorP6_010356 [Peronosclerospora sorghi]|uniref:Uncharacterized protein n=1 Tax=Peronosclerospora sorghi TaxID=230839 RepID=A0ACC0VW67_9STRA|nr:hypothetical protein PsorP6_010356 [Peronosclerospora sorghi]